ncbi:MAG: DUF6159 family protein [Anaerolineae bacterium]
MQRLSNSWRLVKASAAVLRADAELLVFPVVSSVAALIVAASFFVPAWLTGFGQQVMERNADRGIGGYVFLFAFYFVQYVVIFYFNAALVGAAMIRLDGGNPTVADGFRVANAHVANLLGYAAMAATVGVALKALADRGGRAGQTVSRFGGLGWTIATALVVPVLVAEGVGPVDAVKRSAALLKRTWGEQLAGGLGMGFVFGLAFLVTIPIGVVAIVLAAATESAALIVGVVVIFVLALVLIGLVQGALQGIYTAAVYRYAEGKDVGGYFPTELVAAAYRAK